MGFFNLKHIAATIKYGKTYLRLFEHIKMYMIKRSQTFIDA